MNKILITAALLIASLSVYALDVKESDLEGRWLIVKMGTMDVTDMDDVWQFKSGKWTAISSGKALNPDDYKLVGDVIDLGHSKIKIIEFSGKSMKTEQSGFVYTLNKQ